MNDWIKKVEIGRVVTCSVCHRQMAKEEEYCNHLSGRFGFRGVSEGTLFHVEENEDFCFYMWKGTRHPYPQKSPHLYIKKSEILVSLGQEYFSVPTLETAINFWIKRRLSGGQFFEYKIL